MEIRADLLAEDAQLDVHGIGVGGRHKPAIAGAGRRVCRPKQVNPLVLSLTNRSWMAASVRPHPGQRPLLTEARFILEPDFDLLVGMLRLSLLDAFREVFLKKKPLGPAGQPPDASVVEPSSKNQADEAENKRRAASTWH